VKRILDAFVAESLPEGGIDAKKSLWQKPGTGSASGSSMFPGGVDVRYLRFLVEGLYRVAARTTSTDPLVNVGMLWTSAVLGWLNGRQLAEDVPNQR
jgi:hypothetical protein